ncbi:MAG: small basic protein [Candidatus Omnitrophica bacterium]|nr:small basic protein [Candidatus Omnitrophota bacterium]
MSIHPSLSFSEKDKKTRSVLRRSERLKIMIEKNQWKEGDSVFGLPKIKTVRIKIKKEKAAEKPEATATEAAAVPASSTTTKTQASSKEPTSKVQEKK